MLNIQITLNKCLILGILFFAVLSCAKAPINRTLEGNWHLQAVDLYEIPEFQASDSLYMSFQLNLIQLRKATPNDHNVLAPLGYYEYTGDSLSFNMKADLAFMKQWGFHSQNESFAVGKLSKNILVLINKEGKWSFEKF